MSSMTKAELKERLRYVELAGITDSILTTADANYGNKDGYDKAIEQMEMELGYADSYPLDTQAKQYWALSRAKRHSLQLLLNTVMPNFDLSVSAGSFPLSQQAASYRKAIETLDAEFARAKDEGKVPLGDDAADASGFGVTNLAYGYNPEGNLVT